MFEKNILDLLFFDNLTVVMDNESTNGSLIVFEPHTRGKVYRYNNASVHSIMNGILNKYHLNEQDIIIWGNNEQHQLSKQGYHDSNNKYKSIHRNKQLTDGYNKNTLEVVFAREVEYKELMKGCSPHIATHDALMTAYLLKVIEG